MPRKKAVKKTTRKKPSEPEVIEPEVKEVPTGGGIARYRRQHPGRKVGL